MDNKNKKVLMLGVGLTLFALLGTVVLYAAGFGRPASPELADGFKFYKGMSAKELGFSDREVTKLNRSLFRNRDVVDKAILTVIDIALEPSRDEMSRMSELKYSIKIKSKNGMIFTPETSFCGRKKLVKDIVLNIDKGAKVLAGYANDPALKGRQVTIMDM